MYDNGTFRLGLESPAEIWEGKGQVFERYGLLWQPRVDAQTKQTKSFIASCENLHFVLKRNEIKVSNSLQKFLVGNNYEPFSFAQFSQAVYKLNQATGLQWEGARVSRIEYGESLRVNCEPMDFLSRMLSYKGKPYQKMVSRNGIVYGMKVGGWDYEIKAYDKGLETFLQSGKVLPYPIQRFEIVAKNMGYLRNRAAPILAYTITDLLSEETQQRLMNDLTEKFENTLCKARGNLEPLTDAELKTIALVENEEIFNELQKRNPRGAARYRKQYALACKIAAPMEQWNL